MVRTWIRTQKKVVRMKIRGSVSDIKTILMATKFAEAVHFIGRKDGMFVNAMDVNKVCAVSITVPKGYTAISLESVSDEAFNVYVPVKNVLEPLGFFGDEERATLDFTGNGVVLSVDNFERTIQYQDSSDALPVVLPTLSKEIMENAVVSAEDIKRAIRLNQNPADVITFSMTADGLEIRSDSQSTGVKSKFSLKPGQMTLFGAKKSTRSSFDPKYLLNVLPYAKGDVNVSLGSEYPISFSGTLENDLRFVNVIAPRMSDEGVSKTKDGAKNEKAAN